MTTVTMMFRRLACVTALSLLACAAQAQDAHNGDMSRYGGPVYNGKPALGLTASMLDLGGGAGHFSVARAVTAMVGGDLVNAEIQKLTKQYGEEKVALWVKVANFAVEDAARMAMEAGVKLPEPTMTGKKLAAALVRTGMDKDGTFYTELLLDRILTHHIHVAVMDDIDSKFGADADVNYHTISNQAYYDLAQALGMKRVKLSALH